MPGKCLFATLPPHFFAINSFPHELDAPRQAKPGAAVEICARGTRGRSAKPEAIVTCDVSVAHGILRTTSFAYPGNSISPEAIPVLKQVGIRFARRGGSPEYEYREGRGFAYEPGFDHPLLIPSAGDARPDWTLNDFIRAAEQARHGRVAVLQFHGIPDNAHAWVSSSAQQFDGYLNYLAKNEYTVIAMRRP